jgi:hypothetical protein
MAGSSRMARARARRWRCPPERLAAVFVEESVVAERQFFDELVRGGETGGALDGSRVAPGLPKAMFAATGR